MYTYSVTNLGIRKDALALRKMLSSACLELIKLARQARRDRVLDPRGLAAQSALWRSLRKRVIAAQPREGELHVTGLTRAEAAELAELWECCCDSSKLGRKYKTGKVTLTREPANRQVRAIAAAA